MSNPYESPQATNSSAPSSTDWMLESAHNSQTVTAAIEQYFQGEGYRLEDGTPSDGHYGVGNNVLRIIFGAFVKRYKFKVNVVPSGTGCIVYIEKGMTGVMGGAIGYAKMKKELGRVREGVRRFIN